MAQAILAAQKLETLEVLGVAVVTVPQVVMALQGKALLVGTDILTLHRMV